MREDGTAPVAPFRAHLTGVRGTGVANERGMLKLIGSYVLARLLGFGLLGALVIYLLISLLT
jgi:hypothetical protein